MNADGDYWSNSGESEYDPSKWYGADEPEEYNEEEIEEFYGRSSYYDYDEEDLVDDFEDVDSALEDNYYDEGDDLFEESDWGTDYNDDPPAISG